MSEPFIGEICIFPYTFTPRNWGLCNGAIITISQFTSLFAVIGNYYGGDAVNTFWLPNLGDRVPLHVGGASAVGPGLSYHQLGQYGGQASVYLNSDDLPSHDHTVYTEKYTGTEVDTPTAATVPGIMIHEDPNARGSILGYGKPDANMVSMDYKSLAYAGNDLAHENRQPSLVMSYFIAMDGVFPPRS